MSYLGFSSWNAYTDPAGGARTLDWSTDAALQGRFALAYWEAIIQGATLRFPLTYSGHFAPELVHFGTIRALTAVAFLSGLAWHTWYPTPTNAWGWVRPSLAGDLSGNECTFSTPAWFALFLSSESIIVSELGDSAKIAVPPLTTRRASVIAANFTRQTKRALALHSWMACGFDSPAAGSVSFPTAPTPPGGIDATGCKGDIYSAPGTPPIMARIATNYEYGVTGTITHLGGPLFHVLRFGDLWALGS